MEWQVSVDGVYKLSRCVVDGLVTWPGHCEDWMWKGKTKG